MGYLLVGLCYGEQMAEGERNFLFSEKIINSPTYSFIQLTSNSCTLTILCYAIRICYVRCHLLLRTFA